MLCEHLDILLVKEVRKCVNSRLKLRQTSYFCSFLYPSGIITIAVEDYSAVLLYCLYEQFLKSLLEVVSLFKLIGELFKLLSNDRIEYDVGTGDVQCRTNTSELELVTCECKGRSSVSVGCILGELGQSRNAYIEL